MLDIWTFAFLVELDVCQFVAAAAAVSNVVVTREIESRADGHTCVKIGKTACFFRRRRQTAK